MHIALISIASCTYTESLVRPSDMSSVFSTVNYKQYWLLFQLHVIKKLPVTLSYLVVSSPVRVLLTPWDDEKFRAIRNRKTVQNREKKHGEQKDKIVWWVTQRSYKKTNQSNQQNWTTIVSRTDEKVWWYHQNSGGAFTPSVRSEIALYMVILLPGFSLKYK